MRNFMLTLLSFLLLISCNNDSEKAKADTVQPENKIADMVSPQQAMQAAIREELKPYDKFLGSFVGAFGRNKITMLITKVGKDSVSGRTIVGGNDRPFYGTYTSGNGFYFFKGREPGDHKNDGEFNFVMDEKEPDVVRGGWEPYAKGQTGKEYELQRKAFSYRIDVGDYPEASQRLLKAEDVENMYKDDLEFMRNEIFARHGYCFTKRNLRQQFEMQDWYVPNTVDITGHLTEIEKKNIALIKRYEKYADDYGDEYGR